MEQNEKSTGGFIAVAAVVGSVIILLFAGPFVVCVWFIAVFCFYQYGKKRRLQIREINNMLDILTKECDPCRYIEIVAKWEKDNHRSAKGMQVIPMNLGVAYFDSGQYQTACDMVEEIYKEAAAKSSLQLQAVASYNLAVFYFWMDEEEKFILYFNKLSELSEKFKKNVKVSSMLCQCIRNLEMQMEIKEGRVSEALPYYKERFHKMPYGNSGVNSQYWLFRIYEITGDEEGQEDAMNYISSHGGTTIYAAEAREWLKSRAL